MYICHAVSVLIGWHWSRCSGRLCNIQHHVCHQCLCFVCWHCKLLILLSRYCFILFASFEAWRFRRWLQIFNVCKNVCSCSSSSSFLAHTTRSV